MHDLVIRGGTVVDGSGRRAYLADVAVDGGLISEVGRVGGRGLRELDAEGHVVTPGFIDGHTHMDAQMFWDPQGESSCWTGVTTVVMGNCGFTLAPSLDGRRELVVRNLERAEDISAEAMGLGIPWGFESYSEYLDVLDRLPMGINYASQIGHSALRTWAMGERAFDEVATEDDLAQMSRQLISAMESGAVGFTTSRSANHETSDDRPVASRMADWREVSALVEVAGRYPGAMFEISLEPAARSADLEVKREFFDRLVNLAAASRAKFTFGVVPVGHDGAEWRDTLALLDEAVAVGGSMFGQSHCRGFTIYNSFVTQLPFDQLPVWREFRAQPLQQQEAELRDPAVRGRLVQAASEASYGRAIGAEARPPQYDRMEVLLNPMPPNPTVAEVAKQRGIDPVEAIIDLALETDMRQFFVQSLGDTRVETMRTIMQHPATVMTFTDAGAHVSQIVDAALQTYFLAHWVRNLETFTLEQGIRMLTSVPARIWGFDKRGLVREGYTADLNVIDPLTVAPSMPEAVADLPGGGLRLKQKSTGIRATLVNGEVTIFEGVPTPARPGHLIRRGR
jgi:N-acyl-D-aspartate/D-glutamate deacylase